VVLCIFDLVFIDKGTLLPKYPYKKHNGVFCSFCHAFIRDLLPGSVYHKSVYLFPVLISGNICQKFKVFLRGGFLYLLISANLTEKSASIIF